jgi:hypothetical protein
MFRFVYALSLISIIACGSKSDDVSATDDTGPGVGNDNGGGGGCDTPSIGLAYPAADGAGDFYYRGSVEFEFVKNTDEDATIALESSAGEPVSGGLSWVGSILSFTPDAPLANATTYKATLTHCAGSETISFTTGSLGGALEAGTSALIGNTYAVALGEARFVKPEGVGGLLGGLLTQDILIGVVDANDTELSLMGALSEEGSTDQDMCDASIDFPVAADFTTAPYFSINADALALSASGYEIKINDFTLAGDFSADGSYIGGAVLAGLIDARDLTGALVGGGLIEEDDPQAVCDLIGAFGVTCEECSDGKNYCLTIHVDQIDAGLTGDTLVAQDECNPDECASGCDEE